MRVPVYILAGGRSSRFGSDKARATLGGAPLVNRVADVLAPVATGVTVVADRADKYADLGLRTIADREPGLGPLGGLAAALADLPHEEAWLLIVSCDLVALRPEWVTRLLEHASSPARAVAYRGDRWEPLCALYHREAAPLVGARLARRELAMWRLLEALDAQPVPLPDDWPPVAQANTPEELRRYEHGTASSHDHHRSSGSGVAPSNQRLTRE